MILLGTRPVARPTIDARLRATLSILVVPAGALVALVLVVLAYLLTR